MSLADLEGLAEGDGEREALLSDDSEFADPRCRFRAELGRGDSGIGESGMESGDA